MIEKRKENSKEVVMFDRTALAFWVFTAVVTALTWLFSYVLAYTEFNYAAWSSKMIHHLPQLPKILNSMYRIFPLVAFVGIVFGTIFIYLKRFEPISKIALCFVYLLADLLLLLFALFSIYLANQTFHGTIPAP